jgi:hypothetical protein
MNNLLSYCGLVDAKIRASDKDLPVVVHIQSIFRRLMKGIFDVTKFPKLNSRPVYFSQLNGTY